MRVVKGSIILVMEALTISEIVQSMLAWRRLQTQRLLSLQYQIALKRARLKARLKHTKPAQAFGLMVGPKDIFPVPPGATKFS